MDAGEETSPFVSLEAFLAHEGEAMADSSLRLAEAWLHWQETHGRLADAHATLQDALGDDAVWLGEQAASSPELIRLSLMTLTQPVADLLQLLYAQADLLRRLQEHCDRNCDQLVATATLAYLARRPALESVRDVRARGAARRPREGALDAASTLGDDGLDEVRPGVNRLHASPMEHLGPHAPVTAAPRGPTSRSHGRRARAPRTTTIIRDDQSSSGSSASPSPSLSSSAQF